MFTPEVQTMIDDLWRGMTWNGAIPGLVVVVIVALILLAAWWLARRSAADARRHEAYAADARHRIAEDQLHQVQAERDARPHPMD